MARRNTRSRTIEAILDGDSSLSESSSEEFFPPNESSDDSFIESSSSDEEFVLPSDSSEDSVNPFDESSSDDSVNPFDESSSENDNPFDESSSEDDVFASVPMIWCCLCKKRYPEDSFSAKRKMMHRKNYPPGMIYCLAHTSTSSFADSYDRMYSPVPEKVKMIGTDGMSAGSRIRDIMKRK